MSQNPLKIQVMALEGGGNYIRIVGDTCGELQTLQSGLVRYGIEFEKNCIAELCLTKLEPNYYLRGDIRFALWQNCSRCSERLSFPIRHRFELAFIHRARGTIVEEGALSELDVNVFEGNEMDLSPYLEEQIMLSIPYAPLCNSECKGMCQRCGKNLNLGPCECKEQRNKTPFVGLKDFKFKS